MSTSEVGAAVSRIRALRGSELRANVLELLGAVLIVVGVALVAVPAAFVVAGVALLLIAHPVTIPKRGGR